LKVDKSTLPDFFPLLRRVTIKTSPVRKSGQSIECPDFLSVFAPFFGVFCSKTVDKVFWRSRCSLLISFASSNHFPIGNLIWLDLDHSRGSGRLLGTDQKECKNYLKKTCVRVLFINCNCLGAQGNERE